MTYKNSLLADWRLAGITSAVLLGGMFASSAALAAEPAMEEVHAHVERPAEKFVGRSFTGPMKETTLQYHVRFDDLDLASGDDADRLRERVTDAARQACADLDKRHASLGRDLSCIAAARKSAELQVDYAIEQALTAR
jgi:UrcA family protein